MTQAPAGFEPLFRISGYTELIGPLYQRQDDQGLQIGLRIEDKHCNRRGQGHGAVLSALADIAMGYELAFSQKPPISLVTVNLGLDFLGGLQRGDWLTTRVEVDKLGRSLAFARCYLSVENQLIARANGVFKLTKPIEGNES